MVGRDVSVEEGYQAARLTAIHTLGLIRYALGSLDDVVSLSRALCFVLCPPGFDRLHEVSNGASDLFREVFGDEIGSLGRASVGVTALSRNNCFELWLSLECTPVPTAS
ncbi:RidA family protein [Micromonospora endophytica]|uniref:RidA family protein n=1 Tax=Micromonospora endophytica TaxID=515350 RepID=UPI001BB35850|nr:RidA family protein [Micromonospora endophytica]